MGLAWSELTSYEADGDTWVPPGEAKRLLGWRDPQLRGAKRRGCLGLERGERLAVRKTHVRGRIFEFISKRQLTWITSLKESLRAAPADPDELSLGQAKRVAKFSPKTLRKLIKGITTRRLGLTANGRLSMLKFISKRLLLEKIAEHRATSPDWITIAKAVDLLGVNESTLWEWVYRSCPYLGGRCIKWQTGKIPTPPGVMKPGVLLLLSDVKAVAAATKRDVSKTFSDHGRRWVPESTAQARYGTSARVLRYQHSRGRLAMRLVPYYTSTRRTGVARFYAEDALANYFSKSAFPVHNGTRLQDKQPIRAHGLGGPTPKPKRTRRAMEKHLLWKKWNDEGRGYDAIAIKWFDRTGERVHRDTIAKAIKRLPKSG